MQVQGGGQVCWECGRECGRPAHAYAWQRFRSSMHAISDILASCCGGFNVVRCTREEYRRGVLLRSLLTKSFTVVHAVALDTPTPSPCGGACYHHWCRNGGSVPQYSTAQQRSMLRWMDPKRWTRPLVATVTPQGPLNSNGVAARLGTAGVRSPRRPRRHTYIHTYAGVFDRRCNTPMHAPTRARTHFIS